VTMLADDLRAAIGLLTRIPVRVGGAGVAPRAGPAVFPLVGLCIGLLAAIPLATIGAAEPVLAAIAAVGLAALVSGGLHLDGLADTTDALMAPDRARAEAARRDPRVGSGGVIALILVIGAEVAAIVSVIGSDGAAPAAATVVVALTVSRAVPVVAVALLRASAGSPTGGFGAWFADQVGPRDALVATGLAVLGCGLAVAVVGLPVLAIVAVVGGITGGLVTAAIRAARGGFDGDGLGASIELTTLAVLAAMAVVGG
jgi:adenosylcobinamide-GDP ribazoletransferase